MENGTWYTCKISMVYQALSPAEAAKMLVDNIATNPNWYVEVTQIDGERSFTVDTENGEVEEK
jgi:hypothetical protein